MNEKNVIKVTGETFLSIPLVDTSLALEIAEINAKESCAVKTKLVKLYGAFAISPMKKTSVFRRNAISKRRGTTRSTRCAL